MSECAGNDVNCVRVSPHNYYDERGLFGRSTSMGRQSARQDDHVKFVHAYVSAWVTA